MDWWKLRCRHWFRYVQWYCSSLPDNVRACEGHCRVPKWLWIVIYDNIYVRHEAHYISIRDREGDRDQMTVSVRLRPLYCAQSIKCVIPEIKQNT